MNRPSSSTSTTFHNESGWPSRSFPLTRPASLSPPLFLPVTRSRLRCDADLDRWRCDTNKTLTKTMRAVGHPGCGSLVQWTRTRSLHVASGFPSQQEPLDLLSAKHDIHMLLGKRESREKRVTPNHTRRYKTPLRQKQDTSDSDMTDFSNGAQPTSMRMNRRRASVSRTTK